MKRGAFVVVLFLFTSLSAAQDEKPTTLSMAAEERLTIQNGLQSLQILSLQTQIVRGALEQFVKSLEAAHPGFTVDVDRQVYVPKGKEAVK